VYILHKCRALLVATSYKCQALLVEVLHKVATWRHVASLSREGLQNGRGGEKARERWRERDRARERVCVFVCAREDLFCRLYGSFAYVWISRVELYD